MTRDLPKPQQVEWDQFEAKDVANQQVARISLQPTQVPAEERSSTNDFAMEVERLAAQDGKPSASLSSLEHPARVQSDITADTERACTQTHPCDEAKSEDLNPFTATTQGSKCDAADTYASIEAAWRNKEVPSVDAEQIEAGTALEQIRFELDEIITSAREYIERDGAFPLIGWGMGRPRFYQLAPPTLDNWYFIGDLHGDFLAWNTLWNHIKKQPEFRLCFLGDLVDRGRFSVECFAALLKAAMEYPHRLLWIRGNHDEIRFAPSRVPQNGDPTADSTNLLDHGLFESSVSPSEFVEELNKPTSRLPRSTRENVGILFHEVAEQLPRAALFPEGLLATHGGFPLRDHWPALVSVKAFEEQRVLDDFTWTRLSSARYKKGYQLDPDRRARSSDFEFGYQDFEEFCQVVGSQIAEVSIRRMVRGHDHVTGGYDEPPQYARVPVTTINGFGFNHLTNSYTEYREDLVYARYRGSEQPEVIPIRPTSTDRAGICGTRSDVGSSNEPQTSSDEDSVG